MDSEDIESTHRSTRARHATQASYARQYELHVAMPRMLFISRLIT